MRPVVLSNLRQYLVQALRQVSPSQVADAYVLDGLHCHAAAAHDRQQQLPQQLLLGLQLLQHPSCACPRGVQSPTSKGAGSAGTVLLLLRNASVKLYTTRPDRFKWLLCRRLCSSPMLRAFALELCTLLESHAMARTQP